MAYVRLQRHGRQAVDFMSNCSVPQAYLRNMKRFYFQIPSANILECVWALSFTDAKAIAAAEWLPWWNQIQWLNVS